MLCNQVSCPFNSSHTSDHLCVQCRSYMVHLASNSRPEIASFVSRNETLHTSLRLHMKSSIHIDLDQVCSWRDPNLRLLRLGRFLNVHRSEISKCFVMKELISVAVFYTSPALALFLDVHQSQRSTSTCSFFSRCIAQTWRFIS